LAISDPLHGRGVKPVILLEDYEGPLDRLLRQVEKQEIDALTVPVAAVIQQLVDFLEAASYADIDEGGRFLVLAATLLAIKAHLLLPDPEAAAGAEGSHWDELTEQDGLGVTVEQEYLTIKEAARSLQEHAYNWSLSYQRQPFRQPQPELQHELRGDVARLVGAFKEVLVRTGDEPVSYQMGAAVDFDEKMDAVLQQVSGTRGGLPFRRLFSDSDRLEAVYRFLAVLELVFRGRLRLLQRSETGEIILVANTEATSDE
jgi:segregation and condensation protein A